MTFATESAISANLHRRHLTVGQKAAIAVSAMGQLAVEAREPQREAGRTYGRGMDSSGSNEPELSEGRSAEKAAEMVGVAPAPNGLRVSVAD